MTRLHRLKVKVTIQGHMIYNLCLLHISLTIWTSVTLYSIQMFRLVRQCAERMTQLQVSSQGHISRT